MSPTVGEVGLPLEAALLVLLAGVFSAADAALAARLDAWRAAQTASVGETPE